jgi:hypothetical protein
MIKLIQRNLKKKTQMKEEIRKKNLKRQNKIRMMINLIHKVGVDIKILETATR